MPPHITPFAFEAEAFAGDSVQLSCYVARGDLPFNVTWLFRGRPVLADNALGIVTGLMGPRNSLLTIESVSADHSGNYTCVASNQAASVRHTAPLRVNGTIRTAISASICVLVVVGFLPVAALRSVPSCPYPCPYLSSRKVFQKSF